MNPQLLQMFLPYLMQLLGQGGHGGQSPFTSLFGQNAQNTLTGGGDGGGTTGWPNMLQGGAVPGPIMHDPGQVNPSAVVGGQTPVGGQPSVPGMLMHDPGQVQPPPAAAPPNAASTTMPDLSGAWGSLFAGMQNNSLSSAPSNSLFGSY